MRLICRDRSCSLSSLSDVKGDHVSHTSHSDVSLIDVGESIVWAKVIGVTEHTHDQLWVNIDVEGFDAGVGFLLTIECFGRKLREITDVISSPLSGCREGSCEHESNSFLHFICCFCILHI